jgi:hypothetical protein
MFSGGNRELMLVELKCLKKTYNLIPVITYDQKVKVEKSENPAVRSEKIYPESFMYSIAGKYADQKKQLQQLRWI